MSESELAIFYLQIAILTMAARVGGEIASKLRLPAVTGEILVGVIFGATVFQQVYPQLQHALFPAAGANHVALSAVATLGISLFLLGAGMEIDLPLVKKLGKRAIPVSLGGIVFPFLIGFIPAMWFPELLGCHPSAHPLIFALFMGTALSISSLPLMAKILMDLGLYKTEFGMLVISAAVFDDVVGWTIAGIVFSLDKLHDANTFSLVPIATMIGITLAFVIAMLTVGRWLCDKLLRLLYTKCTRPTAVIGFVMGAAMLGAALTQSIGIRGLFGAFMVGVIVGSSPELKEETRKAIEDVVSNFLAPLYFASVGLAVNFAANFDWQMLAIVIAIATVGKIFGCYSAAKLTGMPNRSGLAVGVAMNSRGGIEIVLGMLALQAQIIDARMFVALALMALITSASSGRILERMANAIREEDAATQWR